MYFKEVEMPNIFDLLNTDEFDGVVRHVFGWLGTGTVITHNFDPTQWQTIAGGAVAILTVLWSVASKKFMRAGGTPDPVVPAKVLP